MRCSSCEPFLERYLEATLPPQQMLAIDKHLKACASCAALVTELRVVDALLTTSKVTELAPNFTFAVMAEVRSIAAAASPENSLSPWAVLAFYVVGAWIAFTAAILTLGPKISALAAMSSHLRDSILDAFSAFGGTAQALVPSAPLVVAFVSVVLAIDVMLVVALILFYRNVRPRLAAHLAAVEVL